MTKKRKLSVSQLYWVQKLVKDDLRLCEHYIDLYSSSNKTFQKSEVERCKEKVSAYKALLQLLG